LVTVPVPAIKVMAEAVKASGISDGIRDKIFFKR